MANFIVSYDLNGPSPSHKEVDDLLESLGATRGRILETVWYVGWNGSCETLANAVNGILAAEAAPCAVGTPFPPHCTPAPKLAP